jgi:signal transduction histidine kinase
VNRRTVVVVDDLAELRQIMRLMLEHGGPFTVVGEGANGHEAVSLAEALQPDLLLMDVQMPGGPSGWQVLPEIRQRAPRTAVVILTGSRADPEAPRGDGLAAAVLEKGLPPTDLNARLLAILGLDGHAAETIDVSRDRPAAATDALASAATRIDRQRHDLARTVEELEGFASVASHDLAQPLQVAYGYLEMLRTDFATDMDPTAAAWLDSAIGALERMRRLVQDLLAFARAGNGGPLLEEIPLDDVIDEAVAALAEAVDDRGLDLCRPDLPVVTADPRQLVEVFRQLLANAIRFAPPGTRPTVTVSVEVGPGEWVVTVADEGPGVPEALRDRVFDLFQRGAASAVDGAGVGLAVCRKLVERHGGRIWLEPPHAGSTGATFRFALPRPLT